MIVYICLAVAFILFGINIDDKLLKYMSYVIAVLCVMFMIFRF